MAIQLLTLNQHKCVLQSLLKLAEEFPDPAGHSAGIEYTSIMICFLLNNVSCARSLLALSQSFGDDWFPVPAGYSLTRLLFETEVTAHYIAKAPSDRSKMYIDFGNVLRKREMDVHNKHRHSRDPSWADGMELAWKEHWADRESEINECYAAVLPSFEQKPDKKGKKRVFDKWSGLSIRQMAVEVEHEEAYDVFYSYLSSFSHADIRLADNFLKVSSDGPVWSMKAKELDVSNVYRYAAIFLTCFLTLIGNEFRTWTESEVEARWTIDGA